MFTCGPIFGSFHPCRAAATGSVVLDVLTRGAQRAADRVWLSGAIFMGEKSTFGRDRVEILGGFVFTAVFLRTNLLNYFAY